MKPRFCISVISKCVVVASELITVPLNVNVKIRIPTQQMNEDSQTCNKKSDLESLLLNPQQYYL